MTGERSFFGKVSTSEVEQDKMPVAVFEGMIRAWSIAVRQDLSMSMAR